MTSDRRDLIDGYFDDDLTADQQKALSEWIKADPENARLFVQSALLHDRLRNTLTLEDSSGDVGLSERIQMPQKRMRRFLLTNTLGRATAAAAVLIVGLSSLWFSIGTPTATAAVRELDRIIVNSLRWKDRTYEIVVEDITPDRQGRQPLGPESKRPPKPPLDGATLHLRAGNQFVLIRKTEEGVPFITGCNGQQSWAINTRGPVRVSSDVHRFDRDLPGHETSIPLTNLHEGLQQLKRAYDVTFSALGPEEYSPEDGHEARLLVALKKPKDRGPQRVEIIYDATTGRILRMRFIQMPYGPDRLDLRLSLVGEQELPLDFFEHTTHHASNRKIETEN
jgi:hypothetical protein